MAAAVIVGPILVRADSSGDALAELQRLYDEGRYAEAETKGRVRLETVSRESGPDSLPAADVINEVVRAMQSGGKFEEKETMDLALRALEIRKVRLAAGHPDIAWSLNAVGKILYLRSEYENASAYFERALAILEHAPNTTSAEIELVRQNLGNVLADLGDYARARRLYEQSISVVERLPDIEPTELLSAYMNLGTILYEMGDNEAAREECERALHLGETHLGPTHPHVGMVLANLGEILIQSGEEEEAEPLVRRSLAIRESRLGPDHPRIADSLTSLGRILMRKGRYDEARASLERAQRIQEAKLALDHHFVAMTTSALGTLSLEVGDLDRARSDFQRVLEIDQRKLGVEHPNTASARVSLAMVDLAAGRDSPALDHALEGAGTIRRLIGRMARELSERQTLDYAAIQSSGLDVILSLAARNSRAAGAPDVAVRAFDALVHSRTQVLDEMAARHRSVLEESSGALAPLFETLTKARRDLGAALARAPDPAHPEEFSARVAKARTAVDDAERALAEKSARYRSERTERDAGLDDVVRSLPPGAALVAYARYHQGGTRIQPGLPVYVAFVLANPRREPIVIPLGPASEIELLVAGWRKTISVEKVDAAAAAAYRQAGSDLRRKIWDPVTARLGRPKLVFIIPDGDLHLVNYATLPTTGDGYLLETGPTLHYLSAERDLLAEPTQRDNSRGILTVGGPDFDNPPSSVVASTIRMNESSGTETESPWDPAVSVYRGDVPACARSVGVRFAPLPGSRDEARDVAAQLSRASKGASKEPVLVLTGSEAGEDAVKRLASRRRILHLATHSFWIGEACDPSPGDARADQSRPRTNPLLLTGLALAGVNRRNDPGRSPDQDDGLLTADEISSLDLRGTEWVVMSACQTGVGPVIGGEGVLGLRRAFRVAGARTLVMSLWPIADNDTREWIHELYKARLEGRSTAESMRRASRRIVESRREAGATTHPATWGAFVSSGDWR